MITKKLRKSQLVRGMLQNKEFTLHNLNKLLKAQLKY